MVVQSVEVSGTVAETFVDPLEALETSVVTYYTLDVLYATAICTSLAHTEIYYVFYILCTSSLGLYKENDFVSLVICCIEDDLYKNHLAYTAAICYVFCADCRIYEGTECDEIFCPNHNDYYGNYLTLLATYSIWNVLSHAMKIFSFYDPLLNSAMFLTYRYKQHFSSYSRDRYHSYGSSY